MISHQAWNWCDRRCERCPLSGDCQVYLESRSVQEQARSSGLDLEDFGAAIELAAEQLRETIKQLTLLCAEKGITLAECEDGFIAETPEGRAIADAGLNYTGAVHDLCAGLPRNALAAEACYVSMIVAAKCARLVNSLPIADLDLTREDSALNLLLLQKLLADCEATVELLGVRQGESVAAANQIRAILDRHLRAIGADERRELAAMVESGRAPSPFCVLDAVRPAGVM